MKKDAPMTPPTCWNGSCPFWRGRKGGLARGRCSVGGGVMPELLEVRCPMSDEACKGLLVVETRRK